MVSDSDIVLLGTGIAPLVAANYLLGQGKSVLILNPDWDFFLENSELPMDPFLPDETKESKSHLLNRLKKAWPEQVLGELRPDFPGAVEYWGGAAVPKNDGDAGYQDMEAPFVRNRGRLWVAGGEEISQEYLENFYVECADNGFNPAVLEGIQITKKFPGCNSREQNFFGLYLPKICDTDLYRYRNSLLEYVRERLGAQKVVCGATQIEFIPDGVRFYSDGQARTARIREKMIVFWTPKITNWIQNQAKRFDAKPIKPSGIRVWEEWELASRHTLDPNVVGIYRNMVVWSEVEGSPEHSKSDLNRLVVLRAGGLNTMGDVQEWAQGKSFEDLSDLCLGFLKWENFKISSFRPHAIFEWDQESIWALSKSGPRVDVVCGSDGPLFRVVKTARNACEHTDS
jgi:hypothetical protein